MRSRALIAVVAALLAACSSSSKVAAPATPTPTASPTAAPAPSAAPAPRRVVVDPLTGLLPRTTGAIVAVKVDNAFLARPFQRGLSQAAIVYQELVEGGSTRFMGIFESGTAQHEVGPIRSARESDIGVLRAYGRPDLAFSGAQRAVLRIVHRAAAARQIVDVSYDVLPSLYRLGEHRADARNFFTIPARVGARKPGSGPVDIGLRFGRIGLGKPTSRLSATYSTQSVVNVRYNSRTGRWVLSEGSHIIPVSPANVVVQVVRTHASRFHDVHGMNTPLTISAGSGRAVVLRDGRRFAGTWRRSGFGPTHFLDSRGHDVLLQRGPTWILLLPTTGSATFG